VIALVPVRPLARVAAEALAAVAVEAPTLIPVRSALPAGLVALGPIRGDRLPAVPLVVPFVVSLLPFVVPFVVSLLPLVVPPFVPFVVKGGVVRNPSVVAAVVIAGDGGDGPHRAHDDGRTSQHRPHHQRRHLGTPRRGLGLGRDWALGVQVCRSVPGRRVLGALDAPGAMRNLDVLRVLGVLDAHRAMILVLRILDALDAVRILDAHRAMILVLRILDILAMRILSVGDWVVFFSHGQECRARR